ncbi:MAG: efflux RND transporter permease subunit [Planctomycetes bacterium]|nr:efflux RND transporter permease subunit [Planctomycetota bacterium]
MIVTNILIRNRTTVYVLAVGLIIAGAWCYITLPREAAPDVTVPIIVVSTSYSGVSPEDMETSVTTKIENKLKGLRDVKEITSTTSEGFSQITIEFEPKFDIDTALQKVRDRVDQARGDLPPDADDPEIIEINVSEFPILIVNVAGDVGLVRLKEIADDIKDDVESISGVLEANVLGGREREIRVEIDPDRLAAYRIPISSLIALVPTENVNVSAGSIDTPDSKFSVRVPGEFADPREIQTLVVATVDGKPVYLTDVAEIKDTFKDRTSYARVDGRECVSISVQKRAGENIIRIADEAKDILAEWRKHLPGGVTLAISLDYSDIIHEMVHDLENNIISGFILVAAVIFIVMGVRNAFFVSLAIPMSMLITFSILVLADITLNFVVLFSLTLALGMLVDNAIVIVENIYRHMQAGHLRVEAARMGAAEVAWPVTASTLTTVAAFSPLLFWPGIMGKFMGFLPRTVIITLVASLFVALVVNPALCSRLMKAHGTRKPPQPPKCPTRPPSGVRGASSAPTRSWCAPHWPTAS